MMGTTKQKESASWTAGLVWYNSRINLIKGGKNGRQERLTMIVDNDIFGISVANPVTFSAVVERHSLRLETSAGHELSVYFIGRGVLEPGMEVSRQCPVVRRIRTHCNCLSVKVTQTLRVKALSTWTLYCLAPSLPRKAAVMETERRVL